jgi:hypothetical protein
MSGETYGVRGDEIADVIAWRTPTPLTIDGDLTKPAWADAHRTPRFVDMVSGKPAPLDTSAAVLWDDDFLYVGMWAQEPQVEAHMAERDELLFFENDLEVFIDGGDAYYELEVNALGTVYEVFFIWRDAFLRGGFDRHPEFDVHHPRTVTFAGDHPHTPEAFWHGSHPRGMRWAFLDWDFPGLRCAVRVDGVLNDPTTVDRGWTVELAFPWAGMTHLAGGRPLPPHDGDLWRLLFGRFQRLEARGEEMWPHPGWVANRHGVADTHIPESFTRVHFRTESVTDRAGRDAASAG